MQTFFANVDQKLIFSNLDIGGTDTATIAGGTASHNHWVSMLNNHKVCFAIHLTTWNAGDNVATITVQQATDTNGTGLKAVTSRTHTVAAGTLNASGKKAYVEVDANELDVDNGCCYVRVLVAATDNNGVDDVTCTANLYQPRFSKPQQDDINLILPRDGFGS